MVLIGYVKGRGYTIFTGSNVPYGTEVEEDGYETFPEVLEEAKKFAASFGENFGEKYVPAVSLPAIRAALREYSRKFKI